MAGPTDQTDRLGIHAVGSIFTRLGWAFREQATSDFGIDAHAEKLDLDRIASGRLIALQIKTGASWFRRRGAGYVFYGEERHRAYWTNHSLPVFIILHDPESNLTLWQRVEHHLIEEQSEGRWSIFIPADQTLDSQHEEFILRGISADRATVRRYRLSLDLPLIRRFASEESIFLRIEDWVNKGLNFRGTEVVFDEDAEADADMELNTWLPAYTVDRFMDFHFPWLSWHEHAYADASEGAGEVAVHTLEVELSEIGRAALLLEDFYSRELVPDVRSDTELEIDWERYMEEIENEPDPE